MSQDIASQSTSKSKAKANTNLETISLIHELPRILEESKKEYEQFQCGNFILSENYSKINQSNVSEKNILATGDNLKFMVNLLKTGYTEKINMIYIDPPFFSKADYDAVIKVGNEKIKYQVYKDSWNGNILKYLKMLTVRLLAMYDLLASDGTIWVHLDWHAVHYVKIILDEIFGENHFINEIIWNYKSGGTSKKHFARKHDTILVYSKSDKYQFNILQEKSYNRQFKPYRFKNIEEFQDEQGWYTNVNMKDVWDINMVGRTSTERTGYATQKPEALLKRIVLAASKENDICADFFCGSGTTLTSAVMNNRYFIGCDLSNMAVEYSIQRLIDVKKDFFVYREKSNMIGTGKAIIKLTVEAGQKSNLIAVTIKLEDYILLNNEKDMDKKTLEKVKKLNNDDPLSLVLNWSIDFDYDGKIFKPSVIMTRKKEKIEVICKKNVKTTSSICVKIVDVFGNYTMKFFEEVVQ